MLCARQLCFCATICQCILRVRAIAIANKKRNRAHTAPPYSILSVLCNQFAVCAIARGPRSLHLFALHKSAKHSILNHCVFSHAYRNFRNNHNEGRKIQLLEIGWHQSGAFRFFFFAYLEKKKRISQGFDLFSFLLKSLCLFACVRVDTDQTVDIWLSGEAVETKNTNIKLNKINKHTFILVCIFESIYACIVLNLFEQWAW